MDEYVQDRQSESGGVLLLTLSWWTCFSNDKMEMNVIIYKSVLLCHVLPKHSFIMASVEDGRSRSRSTGSSKRKSILKNIPVYTGMYCSTRVIRKHFWYHQKTLSYTKSHRLFFDPQFPLVLPECICCCK